MSTPFIRAYESYRDWIGLSGSFPVRRRGRGRPPKRKKLTVIGDLHVPFHNRAALKKLVTEEAYDTDTLVINGDLMDAWSTSRYAKSKRLTDPCSEMAESQAVLNLLASSFKEILLVSGNHDARPAKLLVEALPPDVLDYIAMTGPMVFKPLDFLAAGLNNVKVVTPVKTQHAEFPFFVQIGDLVCTHAEVYSKISGKATGTVNQWIHSFAIPAGIIKGPVRAICQGHTHQSSTYLGDYGTLCVEGGCLSTLQDYHGGAKIQTPRPLAIGWSVFYQEQGHTDIRESRFKPL